MNVDYRSIVSDAAKKKLLELAKLYLNILDELKREDIAKVDKFFSIAESSGLGEQFKSLRPFLFLMDDSKKEILRKRILDETNSLMRELDL